MRNVLVLSVAALLAFAQAARADDDDDDPKSLRRPAPARPALPAAAPARPTMPAAAPARPTAPARGSAPPASAPRAESTTLETPRPIAADAPRSPDSPRALAGPRSPDVPRASRPPEPARAAAAAPKPTATAPTTAPAHPAVASKPGWKTTADDDILTPRSLESPRPLVAPAPARGAEPRSPAPSIAGTSPAVTPSVDQPLGAGRTVRVRLLDGQQIVGLVRAELPDALVIDCSLGQLAIPRTRISTLAYDAAAATGAKRAPVQQLDDDDRLPAKKPRL
jgi:hypothetical protein